MSVMTLACGLQCSTAMNFGRVALYTSLVVLAVVGVVTAADAMVITDRERLETFIDELTGTDRVDRIAGAMHFADPNREAVEVVYAGRSRLYDDGREVELEDALRSALGAFEAIELETLQDSVQLFGEDARVALRVRTDEGLTDAQFELRRHEDRWLLRRVAVR